MEIRLIGSVSSKQVPDFYGLDAKLYPGKQLVIVVLVNRDGQLG